MTGAAFPTRLMQEGREIARRVARDRMAFARIAVRARALTPAERRAIRDQMAFARMTVRALWAQGDFRYRARR